MTPYEQGYQARLNNAFKLIFSMDFCPLDADKVGEKYILDSLPMLMCGENTGDVIVGWLDAHYDLAAEMS